MPWEIGEFQNQIRLHRLAFTQLTAEERANFTFIITLNLNETIVDWESSAIPQEFYKHQFLQSCAVLEDLVKVITRIGGVISTSDALRLNIEQHLTTEDHYLWLDPDISYPRTFWKSMLTALELTKSQPELYSILSPCTTKMWDNTWDVITNRDQTAKEPGYHNLYEARFENYFDLEAESLEPMNTVKFGGGWGNLFPASLLQKFTIPREYATYGGIDTYIMFGAEFLRKKGVLQQYRMNNVVTIQDFACSNKEVYRSFTPPLIDQETQRKENEKSQQLFETSVLELIKRLAAEF